MGLDRVRGKFKENGMENKRKWDWKIIWRGRPLPVMYVAVL